MSGDLDAMTCALWGRVAAPQNLVGLLLAMVNLLVHVPFTNLPSLRDYELGTLKEHYDYIIGYRGNGGEVPVDYANTSTPLSDIYLEACNQSGYAYVDYNGPSQFGTKIFIDQMLKTDAMREIGAKPWDVTFPPCAEARPRWSLEYTECLFRHLANPGWHICCSAPMGSHPNAVVDERLRVRGNIAGLRVADASVIPDVVSAPTQAPAMMIGSKAAAMIMEENGAAPQNPVGLLIALVNLIVHVPFTDLPVLRDYELGELRQHYDYVIEYHGEGGEVPVGYANSRTTLSKLFIDACKESGYSIVDYNGPTQSGCSRVQANVANGERFSASKSFIQPVLRKRNNLDVALFSQVTKINFEGNRAVGVTFTRYGTSQNATARREVILSAGTVGSAQLLLLSGVGPREDLDRLQVGLAHTPFLTTLYGCISVISIPTAIEAVQFIGTQYARGPDSPDIEVAIVSSQPATQLTRVEMLNLGMLPEAYDSFLGPRNNVPGFRVVVFHTQPKSRGRIALRSSDPTEYPEIDLRMLEHPDDAKAAAEGTKIFIESILSTKAMTSVGARPWDVPYPPCADAGPRWSTEYIECLFHHLANPGMHICCSAPVGSHSDAVVDERLRVRGNVTGLRVADASVMPVIVSGNTHAPAMMIGSKAAAMIIEDNDVE
ncbi:hypothetical protein MTO96_019478 [Rhipicephalus appendiculatus]